MSIFGYSYPPGCSGPPDDEESISQTREDIWQKLEDVGVSEELLTFVDKRLRDLEILAERECPVCLQRHVEELEKEGELNDRRYCPSLPPPQPF
jgi:hypothetical protein